MTLLPSTRVAIFRIYSENTGNSKKMEKSYIYEQHIQAKSMISNTQAVNSHCRQCNITQRDLILLKECTQTMNNIIYYTLCSKKSDAKIQITITTAYLIRIKYPLSGFNYHLTDVNVANFNKIHYTVSKQQLFEQDAQLSQRDRAAGCVIVFAKSRTLELGGNDLWTL